MKKIALILAIVQIIIFGCKSEAPQAIEENPINEQVNLSNEIIFQINDALTRQPITNQKLIVFTHQNIDLHSTPPKDTIEVAESNSEGDFILSDKIYETDKYIFIEWADSTYDPVKISISDSVINHILWRIGYNYTYGRNEFNLTSKSVMKYRYFKDSISKAPFDKVELFAYKKKKKYDEFAELIDSKKPYYSENQKELWNILWDEFERAVGDDILVHPNAGMWYQPTILVLRKIDDVDMEVLFELFDEAASADKKYNILYGMVIIWNYKFQQKKPFPNSITERIDNVYKEFRVEKKTLFDKIEASPICRDYLKEEKTKMDKIEN